MELLSAPVFCSAEGQDARLKIERRLEVLLAAGGRMSNGQINGKTEGLYLEVGRRVGVLILLCITRYFVFKLSPALGANCCNIDMSYDTSMIRAQAVEKGMLYKFRSVAAAIL